MTQEYYLETEIKLLELLFDYNRIPVRILDESFNTLHFSFDFEPLRSVDFHAEPYRFLTHPDRPDPAMHTVNSAETMAFFLFEREQRSYFLAVGPALLSPLPVDEKRPALSFFPPLQQDELFALASLMPLASIAQFAGYVRLLYTAFTGRETTVEDILAHSTGTDTPRSISEALSASVFEQREKKANHGSFAQEMLLLNTIKSGDMDTLEYLADTFLPQTAFHFSDDPLRQAIYHFIGSIALITRFAVEGGLDEELAFNMNEVYIQKADRCKIPLEVTVLLYTAVRDFTSRVRDTRQQASRSNHIVRCTDYIFRHLHEPVTLDNLSKEAGLSPAYLSALFKRETGLPLADFIQLQRVEEAKNLLRFSDYRISEISAYLAFSSQSYFTSVFKRHTGMTPKKYREANFRKSWI